MKFCILMGSPRADGNAASMKALSNRAIHMPIRRMEL